MINYQQQSSRNYTTTFSGRCVNPPSPSGTAQAKALVLAASNGRAWTRRRRLRRFGSSKNAWPSSRVVELRSLLLFAGPTTASIHLIRALAQTARAANRSKTPLLAHRYHFLFVAAAADMPSTLVAAFGRLFRLRVFRPLAYTYFPWPRRSDIDILAHWCFFTLLQLHHSCRFFTAVCYRCCP